MRKYLFYIDSMQMGGAQRVMNNLIDYFVEQGIEIGLINDIIPSQIEPEYIINKKVKRFFLDDGNTKGIRKNINRIKKLRNLIKKEKPDLVLSFLGPPNIRMLISSIGIHTRKVVSVRNDPQKEYGNGLKGLISKTVFLLADGCVFQTYDARSFFFKETQRKSTIIFNPVHEKFFNCCWSASGTDIVLIGRLQEQKNPILALKAFISISEQYPNHRLVFYGDEELSSTILNIANTCGVSDRVIVFGKTSNVEKVLENAAIYILSSDYEGMPNALMEAMTVGVPVISTNCPCGGPRMLISNKDEGILVPCGDVKSLAEAMKKLLDSKDLQRTLSKNERQRAKEFHPQKILKEWDKYLRECN